MACIIIIQPVKELHISGKKLGRWSKNNKKEALRLRAGIALANYVDQETPPVFPDEFPESLVDVALHEDFIESGYMVVSTGRMAEKFNPILGGREERYMVWSTRISENKLTSAWSKKHAEGCAYELLMQMQVKDRKSNVIADHTLILYF